MSIGRGQPTGGGKGPTGFAPPQQAQVADSNPQPSDPSGYSATAAITNFAPPGAGIMGAPFALGGRSPGNYVPMPTPMPMPTPAQQTPPPQPATPSPFPTGQQMPGRPPMMVGLTPQAPSANRSTMRSPYSGALRQ